MYVDTHNLIFPGPIMQPSKHLEDTGQNGNIMETPTQAEDN